MGQSFNYEEIDILIKQNKKLSEEVLDLKMLLKAYEENEKNKVEFEKDELPPIPEELS